MSNATKFRVETVRQAGVHGWDTFESAAVDTFIHGAHTLTVTYTPRDFIRFAEVARSGELVMRIDGAKKLDKVRSILASASTTTSDLAPAALVASPVRPEKPAAAVVEPGDLSRTEPMTMDEARAHAERLLAEHGLDAKGWIVKFDNAKTRAGVCNYTYRFIGLSRLQLSLRPAADTYNTITHEIAHALTPGHHHDATWAAKHRELGGDGKRCFESSAVDPNAPWIGTCGHDTKFARYRKPRGTYRCRCGGVSSSLIEWRDNRKTR